MYPFSAAAHAGVCARDQYTRLFVEVGGQVSGEGPCGIYYNIIPRCAQYVPSQGKVFGFYQGTDLRPWAFTYNPATGEKTGPVSIGGSGLSGDSHGAPTMTIDGDGYIYVFWGCHTSYCYYRKSTNPYDISSWGAEGYIGAYVTYPSIFKVGSNWYLFHRTQNTYPLGWGYNRTPDFSTWYGTTQVIKSDLSSDAYYAILGQSANGNIHMCWCIWDGSIYKNLYYAYTADMATWRKADGTAYVDMPMDNVTSELVYASDPNNLRTQTGDIQFDSNNRPHIIFNDNWTWRHAGWDGDEWIISAITSDATNNLHVPATLIVLADNDFRVFLGFSPVGDESAVKASLREYQSTDGGATWKRINVIAGDMYRGCLNRIEGGIEGCRFMMCGSERDSNDICIF